MLRGFVFALFLIAFFCGVASLFGTDWASIRRNGERISTLALWQECRSSNLTFGTVRADVCRGYNVNGDDVESKYAVSVCQSLYHVGGHFYSILFCA